MLMIIAGIREEGTGRLGIGSKGSLPWPRLDGDMKLFWKASMGKAVPELGLPEESSIPTVIMGRTTWDSLPTRPLPYRTNLVLSSKLSQGAYLEGARRVYSLQEALDLCTSKGSTPILIGGAKVYQLALDLGLVSSVLLTEVRGPVDHSAIDTWVDLPLLGTDYAPGPQMDLSCSAPYRAQTCLYRKKKG